MFSYMKLNELLKTLEKRSKGLLSKGFGELEDYFPSTEGKNGDELEGFEERALNISHMGIQAPKRN